VDRGRLAADTARYVDMLAECEREISNNVTANLLEGHRRPIFLVEDRGAA
jgi:hypothetical protein